MTTQKWKQVATRLIHDSIYYVFSASSFWLLAACKHWRQGIPGSESTSNSISEKSTQRTTSRYVTRSWPKPFFWSLKLNSCYWAQAASLSIRSPIIENWQLNKLWCWSKLWNIRTRCTHETWLAYMSVWIFLMLAIRGARDWKVWACNWFPYSLQVRNSDSNHGHHCHCIVWDNDGTWVHMLQFKLAVTHIKAKIICVLCKFK